MSLHGWRYGAMCAMSEAAPVAGARPGGLALEVAAALDERAMWGRFGP